MTEQELRDLLAGLTADRDQAEAAFGEALGVGRGIPLDALFLVSPDVGMRLTREGVIPPNVRISWMLPPKTMYAVDRAVFDGVTTSVTVNSSKDLPVDG